MQRGRGTAIVVVVLLLLLTALLAGCGSNATTTTQASTATTAAPPTTGSTPTSVTPTTGGATPTSAAGPATGEPIKVGVIISLTGAAASPSASTLNAIQLEVEAINAAGGVNGRPIALSIEDDGSDLQKATSAATKLIEQTKVAAVLGPFIPYGVPAVKEITEKAQVPEIIYMAPTMTDLGMKMKWSFSVGQSIPYNAQCFMELFQKEGYKKILTIADSLPTSVDHIPVLQDLIKANGGQPELVVMPDTWNDGDPDVSPIITKIADQLKSTKPDALLLLSNVVHFPIISKGLKGLGFTLPIICEPSIPLPVSLQMQGPEALEGVIGPSAGIINAAEIPADDPAKQLLMDVTARYTAKYNQPPDMFAGFGYDAIHILYNAMLTAGDDRAKIRDAIEATKDWQGTTGTFTYTADDHVGVHNGYYVWKVVGGQFKYQYTCSPQKQ